MRLGEQAEAIHRRAVKAVSDRKSELAENTLEISAERYIDADRFRREEALFISHPAPLLPVSELPEPFGFVAVDGPLGKPILLARAQSGAVQAFANQCRHRGARLLEGTQSARRALSCPYHAWTYDLSGALHSIYGKEHGIDNQDALGLRRYPTAVVGGFVWALLQEAPIAAVLSDLSSELSTLSIDSPKRLSGYSLDGNFNWKLGVEAFLEVYHFQPAHASLRGMEVQNVALFDFWDDLLRITVPIRKPGGEGLAGLREDCHFMYFIFPNHFFLVFKEHFGWLTIEPKTVGQSVLHYRGFAFGQAAEDSVLARSEQSVQFIRNVHNEDILLCNSIQRGLEAEVRLRFTRFEPAIQEFHRRIERELKVQRGAVDRP